MVTKSKALLTYSLPETAISFMKQYIKIDINEETEAMSKQMIINRIRDKDALICMLTDIIDSDIINAGKHLRIIANYAVGYNNIDIEQATKKGIAVTNTPGVLTETTADLTFALLLALARRIPQADYFVRQGRFKGWRPLLFLGADVFGKKLGIIGFGRIGQAVAKRAQGFDMEILYNDLAPVSKEIANSLKAQYRPLDVVLRESDFICLHVPLNDKTHHLISTREFSLIKESAFVINISRGSVIDEKALVHALKEESIAGCALDVYEHEPAVEKELLDFKNTVFVPHIGSASTETRTRMAMMVAENVIDFLVHDKKPKNHVNAEVFQ